MDKKICEQCGKEFVPDNPQQEYCSEKCWEKHIENLKDGNKK
jgi:hypothetical protein